MSAIVKRILLLSLALILSFTLIGCAGGGLSQEEIDRIVANAAAAATDINTGKADMDMSISMNRVGGAEPMEVTMVADGTSAVDKVAEEGQVVMNVHLKSAQMERAVTWKYYVVGEWLYVGAEVSGQGQGWEKGKKAKWAYDMWWLETGAGQQIKLLTTVTEIKYLGSEAVNGTDCYLLEITPSMEVAANFISQQLQFIDPDIGEFGADLLKEISVKQWIAKDSYLLMKAEVSALLEMRPEDVGATEDDFEKMTIDMDIGARYYDYNQPVDITLPPEALEAEEAE